MKPYEMDKVIITGPKNMQESVVKELHSMKILHIVDHVKDESADIGIPLEMAQKYSELLVKTRALISSLGIKKDDDCRQITNIDRIDRIVSSVNEQFILISDKIKNADDAKIKNNILISELSSIQEIRIPIEDFADTKTLSCFCGYVKGEDSLKKIRMDFSKMRHQIFESRSEGKIFVIIFSESKLRQKAEEILQKAGFLSSNLQNFRTLKGYAKENLENCIKESKKIEESRAELVKRLEALKSENKGLLLSVESYLAEQVEICEAPLRFASTKSVFLIKGWVPRKDLKKSVEGIEKLLGKKGHVHTESSKKSDKVPIKLNNMKPAKPFEFFIDLYSYPSHREIDPTLFMFFTFPLFFGAMLGDIGYGVVGLLVFYFAKKIVPAGKNLINSLMFASFASILFGGLFGEFFGYEFIHHPIISREHEMMKLMYFSIALGIMHVNIGLIAGFFNELKSHGFWHAVFAKISWMILEIGVVLVALPHVSAIKIAGWIGYSVIGASAVMLFIGEGARGLIELPSIFTNILSYARIMAIGLSSVIIAVIINESAIEMIHSGGIMIVFGVLILILGHALNILLGMFGGFLHSLRLHYVEFFSKFFHGGGKKFSPFGLKE